MSSIPYNSKAYLDAKVSMADNGTVDAGKQMQSPASAGSRGLAKTMTFSKDKTQMQLGQEAIAESMVEIRSIMNRIDGVNVPTNEMNELADNDKMEFTKLLLDMSVMKDRVQALSVDEDAKASAIQSLTSAEESLVALDETAVKEDDMQDMTITDIEAQLGKINDEITFLKIDQKDKESALAALGALRTVLDKYQSQKESAVQEDAGDEQKWMNYAKFWKFVNEIFKDKAEEDISDQFISATTVDEEPSYTTSKELMQRQLKKQNTPFNINIDDDLSEFSNELNGRYEDETDMAKMKQAAIEIIKTGSTQIEPVKNAGTLSTYVQEDAGSLTDQQKQGLQAIYKKYGNYEGYGNGDSLPIGNMEQVIDPGSTLWADDKEYKELDAYMKKMGYDGFEDAQDKDEDFFDNAMKEMPISSAMQDDISKVLGNDYYQKSNLAKAAKDYMSSSDESTPEDSGELARLKELSGIEEDTNDDLMQWAKKYSQYKNLEDDNLIEALYDFAFDLGITQFIFEVGELQAAEQKLGKKQEDWEDAEINAAMEMSPISNGLIDDLHRILPGNAELEQKLDSIRGQLEKAGLKEDKYQPMPEGDEFDIAEDEDFEEVLGSLGFPEDETELFDAEYQGRKVPLNKPMRGDSKKFKVYVKDPKTGNVKKVNFGHGGTSAKKLGQKTMKIRKSNPKARKSFRARHNCANPGPKTKARYWSCRKW
jgi:hypothetical protein